MEKIIHVISREKARELGMIRFFTGLPCRNGHYEERLVSVNLCLACARKNNKAHYKRALAFQRATPEGRARRIKNDHRYLEANKDRINARRRERYEEIADIKRKQRREWVAVNRSSVLASQRRIKFLRIRRAPPWLTVEHWKMMEDFYEKSASITEHTGIIHHVDHIVPLVGKLVSGLHVPWNLQVIPANDNLKKGNSFAV